MITDAVFTLIMSVLGKARDAFWSWLDSHVPHPPDWATQGGFTIHQVIEKAGALDSWVPISMAAVVIAIMPLTILAGLGIKLARVAISFVTLGGGSAG